MKKLVLSILLVFTYLLGFVHNVIPHHHAGDHEHHVEVDQELGHHHHGHHDHNTEGSSDHAHISHEDHVDGGIFDLVLCIFNEVEHTSSTHHSVHLSSINSISIKSGFKSIPFNALLLDRSYELHSNSKLEKIDAAQASDLCAVLLVSPLRGPPIFSC